MITYGTTTADMLQKEMEREGEDYLEDLWNQDDTPLGTHETPMDEGFNTW